ncbi:DUF1569 domain-containing protein [Jejudonia soesokkakensis]|uniref:DUF1569 domain-containing protein n=1 Tax=Jejudonia soesokkakensis TaxID=1323432 RepID=A0ABW2MWN4_9FLAO
MKSLFTTEAYSEIKNRLNSMSETSQRQWGKMTAGQMAHHCQKAFLVPLEKTTPKKPPLFMRLMIPFFKKSLYNDKPWKKGMPTPKEFQVRDDRDFEKERERLLSLIDEFHQKGEAHNWPKHPAFGEFTTQQWGQMEYKHLDHHLRQFGV